MTTDDRVSILVALSVLMAAGVYIAKTAPEAALAATWTPPPVAGCYAPADAYLVAWQTQAGTAGRDTTFSPAWPESAYPAGVFRFRVAAYTFALNSNGNVVGWSIGRPLSGSGCAVAVAETLWSDWSGWATAGSPGQPSAPVFGAVLK